VPVIFLSGLGDIPSAAAGIKGGAVDFLEKGADPAQILRAVHDAINLSAELAAKKSQRAELEQLFNRPVDLVENQAIRNPIFRNVIDREKQLIYERKSS